jgi:hypothetical protein
MPRFFVQLTVDSQVDHMALEFSSPEAVIEDANRAWAHILRENARDCRIEISDEDGRVVATVPQGSKANSHPEIQRASSSQQDHEL